jgi:hypothetical protein
MKELEVAELGIQQTFFGFEFFEVSYDPSFQ